jgi:uncharacterized protein involved in response to NO
MLARVALGHTGRPLRAARPMAVGFVLLTLSALVRVGVPLLAPAAYRSSVLLAGVLWTAAFALYLWVYAPILVRPRADARPG